jgi:hypothetical protein
MGAQFFCGHRTTCTCAIANGNRRRTKRAETREGTNLK